MAKSSLMKRANLKSNQFLATCPACGLLCDDLQLKNNAVVNTNCTKGIAFFTQNLALDLDKVSPKINGRPVTLQAAISKATQLLQKSKKPIFTGLSTDVEGFRSLFYLAQKTNASLQHMNSQSTAHNMKVLQSTGWQTTTLTEVKNRADVIVCIGGDLLSHNPRFFERFIAQDGMFIGAKQREVIFIGENISSKKVKKHTLEGAWILACRTYDLAEITTVLRALVLGKKLKASEVAGIKVSDLQTVAEKLKVAKYAVLAWVAKDFDFPHAELTIQNITETVAILNSTSRAAGLPLGGSDGDTTTNNVNIWLSGLTLNNQAIEHDLVLWVNSFSPEKLPKKTSNPLIVIGNSRCELEQTPDVFIPIATPGLDCNGTLFRVDSSVILPLKKVRENDLPTLSEVLNQLEAQLK